MTDPELTPPFDLYEPAHPAGPVVFDSPHSGRCYPRSFLAASRLEPTALRRSEDAFVDELLAGVAASGTPLLSARFPRAYLDVNREPYELDARLFEGRLPGYANTRSLRVAGGLGTIARVVGEAQEIYPGRLPVEEALRRIETLYRPYHRALRRLLGRVHRLHGHVVLVDCHSMPSGGSREGCRADVVLGDRYGTSCAGPVTDAAEAALEARGYRVTRNKPYAGGYIAEHYGQPAGGFHVLQVELCRSLYMDEARFVRREGFEALGSALVALRDALAVLPLGTGRPPGPDPWPMAAE